MNVIEWIDNQRTEQDTSRTSRQWDSIIKFVNADARATLEIATGFGKTRIALYCIQMMNRNTKRSVMIVVPTKALHSQWTGLIKEWGLEASIYIINTVIRNTYTVDFLITDETHKFSANTFQRIFSCVKYKFILGLTGTFTRADGKHTIMNKYAPICDQITQTEARREGWVTNFTQFNVMVTESDTWYREYNNQETTFAQCFSRFGSDFQLMIYCSYSLDPSRGVPAAVTLARRLGWRGNSIERARSLRASGSTISNCWGGNTEDYRSPGKLQMKAIWAMKANRNMKSMLYESIAKREAAVQILNNYPDKRALTFGQSTESADWIATRTTDSKAYHTNIASGTTRVKWKKEYKTLVGAMKAIERNPELTRDNMSVSEWKQKKVSGTSIAKNNLERFLNNKFRILCTAKALSEGIDVPDAELGVIVSRTSSATDQSQRVGRISRHHTFENGRVKDAIVINLVVKDTRDEKWIKSAQARMRDIKQVTLNEILNERIPRIQ